MCKRPILFGGKTVEPGGFGVIPRKPAAAGLVQKPEICLSSHMALFGGKPIKPGSFLIALEQAATTVQIETAEIVLACGITLLRGTFIEANSWRSSFGNPPRPVS